jgi:hypothetical protein
VQKHDLEVGAHKKMKKKMQDLKVGASEERSIKALVNRALIEP